MSNFVDLFNEDKSDIQKSYAMRDKADRLSGSHDKLTREEKKDAENQSKESSSRRSKGIARSNGANKSLQSSSGKDKADYYNNLSKEKADNRKRRDGNGYMTGIGSKTASHKESFHFGPSFEAGYLDRLLEENDDYSIMESTYDGSAINDDEDPTEPSVDDIVNTEPDLASNYHFGPAFGQDIFSKSTLKHSRK